MANARSPTPICGAASPTHAGEARMVSVRSTARARAPSSMRSSGAATRLSTGSGRRRTGRTDKPALEDVGVGRVQRALDAEVGRQRVEPGAQVVGVDGGRN